MQQYYSTQYSNYYTYYLMITKDCRPRLLLTVPQVTQKNFSKIKCCEVGFIPPENFASWGHPNVSSQHCCMEGNGKALKYDSPSVGALCLTSNNVKMEQTLSITYIDLLVCVISTSLK